MKFAWNQNGVAYPTWYGARVEEINAPMRVLRARADYVFNQSAFCQDCAQRFLGESTAPSEIAFNCVDMQRFHPVEPMGTGVCQLLAAGSHHESYRVLSLLDAVAELKRRKLLVLLNLSVRFVWPGAE